MDPQRPLMSTELLKAAINGDKTKLIDLLGLPEQGIPNSASVPIGRSTVEQQRNNLQSATRMGDTVLHVLAGNGHVELAISTYRKETALLSHATKSGDTPLHCAARYGHATVISELIDAAKDAQSQLPTEFKDVLRKKNKHGETALHEAGRYGSDETVSALMVADLELAGVLNKNGESPLYIATAEGRKAAVSKIVALLINKDITRMYYCGPEERTALHAAVFRSNGSDLANELLKLEGTIRTSEQARAQGQEYEPFARRADTMGSTPLHYAAVCGRTDAAQVLLQSDPSLAYYPDKNTLFPVHVASLMPTARSVHHAEFISWLMEKCPDLGELQDSRGRNFFHYIVGRSEDELLRSLYDKHRSKSCWIKKNFMEAIGRDNEENDPNLYIEKMFKKAINARDNDGNTPLCLAAARRFHIAKELLKMKWVDVNSREDILLHSDLVLQLDFKFPGSSDDLKAMYNRYNNIRRWMMGKGQDRKSWYGDFRGRALMEEERKKEARLRDSIQVTGLGSVLIATVTFTAGLAVPGDYDNGKPALAEKYVFKAFLVANIIAFISSFVCTLLLAIGSKIRGRARQEGFMTLPRTLFGTSAVFMILAFGLGMYATLEPSSKKFSIALLVLVLMAYPAYILCEFLGIQMAHGNSWRDIRNYIKERADPYSVRAIFALILPIILVIFFPRIK